MAWTRPWFRRYAWILLGAATLLLRWLFGYFPEFVEAAYSRGFFLGVRWILDHSIGLLPFPFSYVLALGLLVWMGWRLVRWWRRRGERGSWKLRLALGLRHVFSILGAMVFLFFWLWGFNYQRLPVSEQIGLELEKPEVETLEDLHVELVRRAAEARSLIPDVIPTDSISPSQLGEDLEKRVRGALKECLASLGYPSRGKVRARMVVPGGWMLRLNVAGIYNPFSGEGNVSGALTPVQKPFTMGHEMSHGFGFGDEGTCNFLSGLACSESSDPVLRYSGLYSLLRYAGSELRRADPEAYQAQYDSLDMGVKADIEAARRNYYRYKGALSKAGERVNDTYLKAQGIKGGIENYNRVVLMYLAWRKAGR